MKLEENYNGMANEQLVRTITGTDVSVNNSLRELSNMSVKELTSIKGIGEKTAKKLLAAFELGRRLLAESPERKRLDLSIDIYNHLRPLMEQQNVESAYLVCMNNNFEELKTVKLSEGGYTETVLDVRVIMKHAVLNNATIIAIAHYHPSGSPLQSKQDDKLTFDIKKACEMMRIYFMDHVILANNRFYSYHDTGRL